MNHPAHTTESYVENRNHFYNELNTPFWADLDGTEYATFNVHALPHQKKTAIYEAIRAIAPVFKRTAELVRVLPDETLLELGYPKETLRYLRLEKNVMDNSIGRFDFMFDGDMPKVIEFNADTPTFIKELFHVSGKLSKRLGFADINELEEKHLKETMERAIDGAVQDSGKKSPAVLFVANRSSTEDFLTIQYLAELVDQPFAALEDLEIVPGVGLFHNEQQVDILYRQTWAVEIIAEEESEAGERIGESLIQLIEDDLLQVINPPASFLLQNKMLLALMWHLVEEGNPLFTEEMQQAVRTYIPKSYFYQEDIPSTETTFVQKPIFGREGNSVSVLTESGTVASALEHDFTAMPQLYQSFIPPTFTTIETVQGELEGNLVFGAFVLGLERPSAIGARFTAGDGITGNNALFVAVSEEKQDL